MQQRVPQNKKEESSFNMQRKEHLWKFKAFVARLLCRAVQQMLEESYVSDDGDDNDNEDEYEDDSD